MNRILAIAFAGALATVAFAQRSAPNTYGSAPGGFGNVLYPGTGRPPQTHYPGVSRPGGAVGGVGRVTGPPISHPSHNRRVIVPYPVYVGGFGGYYSGFDTPAPVYYQDHGSENQNQQAAPPVVIINQGYRPDTANPVLRDYSDMPPPESSSLRSYDAPVHPTPDPKERAAAKAESERPTIYLLAFKDHTVLASLAYWVEGDTLNYVTKDGKPNSVSLALVDKDLSRQINRQLNVEFALP